MKILVHDYAGHPFQVQLSRELARRGHDVLHLYYGHNNTPKGDLELRASDPKKFMVEGVYTKEPIQKYSFIKRWLQDIEYGHILAKRINSFCPEVLISANTPLDAQVRIMKACRRMGSSFVFWLQDVSGLAAYRLLSKKVPVLGALIGRYHINLERSMLGDSNRVVLIANEFIPLVEEWGVKRNLIKVIPNWAPLEDLPVREKINPWSIQHNIANKFCFLYTGGLGLKHNPNLLLQLSMEYKDNDHVRIVVVSEGSGASWLRDKKCELGLPNLMILGYQPFHQVPDVMAAGDVLVAILEPDAGLFSVPSKVLTYLCAQRAILLALPLDNLAAKIVIDNNAGLVVSPRDMDSFIKSAEKLMKDKELRDKCAVNARMYAQSSFNIQKIAAHFEEAILCSL